MGKYCITHYSGKSSLHKWYDTILPSWKSDYSNTSNSSAYVMAYSYLFCKILVLSDLNGKRRKPSTLQSLLLHHFSFSKRKEKYFPGCIHVPRALKVVTAAIELDGTSLTVKAKIQVSTPTTAAASTLC